MMPSYASVASPAARLEAAWRAEAGGQEADGRLSREEEPLCLHPEHSSVKGERWFHLGAGEGKVQLNHWMRVRSRLDLWLRVHRLEGTRREHHPESGTGLPFQMWGRSVGSEKLCKLLKITRQGVQMQAETTQSL